MTGVGGLSLTPAATYTNNVNAGMATASYSYAGDTNHTGSTGSQTFTISQAPLTITALPASMIYGGPFPTLAAAYSGFVHGETAAVLATPAALATTATPTSVVGTYPITVGGATAQNYAITFVNGVLTVTPASLTITADNQSRWVGAANPALTVTYTGFVNGDTAASLTTPVSVTTTAALLSPSGSYPIVVSGAADPNYTITFVNGTLTVTGLQPVAQGVRAAIAKLTPTGNRELDHEIREALRQIDASLQARLWQDDSHLTARGQFVFEAAREAVSELTEHEIARRAPAALVSQLAAQADILVKVNRALAQLPLDEATAAGVDARRLTDPTKDIAEGDTQAAKPGGGDEAIRHYRDAWQDVQRAVRVLTHDADRDGDRDPPVGKGAGGHDKGGPDRKGGRAPDPHHKGGHYGWPLEAVITCARGHHPTTPRTTSSSALSPADAPSLLS